MPCLGVRIPKCSCGSYLAGGFGRTRPVTSSSSSVLLLPTLLAVPPDRLPHAAPSRRSSRGRVLTDDALDESCQHARRSAPQGLSRGRGGGGRSAGRSGYCTGGRSCSSYSVSAARKHGRVRCAVRRVVDDVVPARTRRLRTGSTSTLARAPVRAPHARRCAFVAGGRRRAVVVDEARLAAGKKAELRKALLVCALLAVYPRAELRLGLRRRPAARAHRGTCTQRLSEAWLGSHAPGTA